MKDMIRRHALSCGPAREVEPAAFLLDESQAVADLETAAAVSADAPARLVSVERYPRAVVPSRRFAGLSCVQRRWSPNAYGSDGPQMSGRCSLVARHRRRAKRTRGERTGFEGAEITRSMDEKADSRLSGVCSMSQPGRSMSLWILGFSVIVIVLRTEPAWAQGMPSSVVAWGDNSNGQCSVPSPNSGFVAVAAGRFHSLGLKADGSVVGWGNNGYPHAPAPNTNYVALAAGETHSLGLRAERFDRGMGSK
jgi:hypothetical protein